jgi:hypothetical protein
MPAPRKAELRSQAASNEISTPWRERPFLPIKTAAEIAGLSSATLYRFETEGRLSFKRLAGRTFVDTASFATLLQSAEPWTPSKAGTAARAARATRAAQARV